MGEAPRDDLNEADELEAEIAALRERTQAIAAELEARVTDRVERARAQFERVKRGVDLPLQVRTHPRGAIAVGAALVALVGGTVALLLRRRARLARLERRWQRRVLRRVQNLLNP